MSDDTGSTLATPIGATTYAQRRDRVAALSRDAGAEVSVWWGNHRVFYLCGFAFAPTERPIALVIGADERALLFVPRLELEHARAYAHVDEVVAYPEYPGERHPMHHLLEALRVAGLRTTFAGDGDGAPAVMGYRGPALSELGGVAFVPLADAIERMMQVKSAEEVALIRESARWAGRAHRLLQELTRPGLTETEVEQAVTAQATKELLDAYQGRYRAFTWGLAGPWATYRGQVGAHSAFPHALNVNAVFQPGDTLVTGATCPMFGYWSELERTMFMGEPSAEQRRFFAHMLALQELAIDACRVGRPCSSVDRAVRAYVERHGLGATWRHHVGHNVGLRYHEGPFLDIGDDTPMEAGMLFTVEPGVYVEGLGGFRHSDTILVTDDGPEFLTDYPRDIDALVIAL